MTVADQRILRGVSATLSWQNVDGDGTAAAPAGTVTVGVTKADGSMLVAAGTATSGTGSDPRTYALSAANNLALDLLTVTWTDGGDSSTHTTYVEVVGGYYFSVAEARASDQSLTNTATYTDAAIIAARREVEEEFERICGVAFVPRYNRQTIVSPQPLLLEHGKVRTLRSVRDYSTATAYSTVAASDLAELVGSPSLRSLAGYTFSGPRLVVEYEHGYDRPPAEVKRAALQRLRYRLNMAKSAIPDRATSFSIDQGGTYRLDTADASSTGQPDIDAVLDRYAERVLFA